MLVMVWVKGRRLDEGAEMRNQWDQDYIAINIGTRKNKGLRGGDWWMAGLGSP